MSRLPHALSAAGAAFRESWRAERGRRAFTWTSYLAYLYAAFWALGTVISLVQALSGGDLTLNIPVQTFWPRLPAGAHLESGTAHVVAGGFTQASLTVGGLGWAARGWLIATHLLMGVANVAIGLSVRVLIRRVRGGSPFGQALSRLFSTCAGLVIGCGLAWQLCSGIAGAIASHELLGGRAAQVPARIAFDLDRIVGLPMADGQISIDFWPIGVGLVLLVLARLVAIGGRMQRDTEGLV